MIQSYNYTAIQLHRKTELKLETKDKEHASDNSCTASLGNCTVEPKFSVIHLRT